MSRHDAEYLRRCGPAWGVPARDPFSATGLQGPEQLPWPRNLFGLPASIAELMASSTHVGQNDDVGGSYRCHKEQKHTHVADVASTVPPRPRCYPFPLASLQEPEEPGAEAATGP
jgi:hypothetical protein